MSGYGRARYGSRRGHGFTPGRVARPNRRPGACHYCAEEIPAGGGELWRETDGGWSVVHAAESQGGWLMNPQPVTGGCPDSTDRRNAELHESGFFGPGAAAPKSERDRIAARAARFAASTPEPARRSSYAVLNGGAVVQASGRRCEDAPCCGCCD